MDTPDGQSISLRQLKKVCPQCGGEFEEAGQTCPFDQAWLTVRPAGTPTSGNPEKVIKAEHDSGAPPDLGYGLPESSGSAANNAEHLSAMVANDNIDNGVPDSLEAFSTGSATGSRRKVFAERYQILEQLGRGGMSTVYKAHHLLMKKDCAIKMLHSHKSTDIVSVRRFQQEAEATSKLSHPNIVAVYDFGISGDGEPFLVMEYLEGESLDDIIKMLGGISIQSCSRIFAKVLTGLAHAHSKNIIHRDLKPSNIMIYGFDSEEEQVRIVDFGIAKLLEESETQSLTETGETIGSPYYMSPEQCSGQQASVGADIYAIACVIYECLTGRPPFKGAMALDTFNKHIKELPPPLTVTARGEKIPPMLEAAIMKALEKEPKRRHASAEIFRQSLIDAIDKSKEQEAFQFLLKRGQTRLNRLRQRLGENLVKVLAVCFAIIAGTTALIAFNPTLKDSLHRAWSPTLFSIYKTCGDLLAPFDYNDAKLFLLQSVNEADYLNITDIRINSRDSLQNLYQRFGHRAEWKELDGDIKAIKSEWLMSRLQVSMNAEDNLTAELLADAAVPADAAKAASMAEHLTQLAQRSLRRGAYPLAQMQAKQAVSVITSLNGAKSELLLAPLNTIASALEREGKLQESTEISLKAQKLESENPRVAFTARVLTSLNLARLAQQQSKPAEADTFYKRALSDARAGDSVTDNGASLKECLSDYAAYLRQDQRAQEADKLEEELNQVRAKYKDSSAADRTTR